MLALFLGGLALGYALFGHVTRTLVSRAAARGRTPPLLLLYGGVEAGIGLHALCFPWLFLGAQRLSLAIPVEVGGTGFLLDVGITALLILPPTVLMGATIPLLTEALARSVEDATRFHAFIYAFNTVGAFIGALAAGFVLVPLWGLERVVLTMGFVNLAAGAAFAGLGLWRRASATPAPGDLAHRGPALGAYAAVALLVGFAAMALQTVLIRIGGLSLGSSEFTFSMVVAVFVLCIALGSFAVSALPRVPRGLVVGVLWALCGLLALLYLRIDEAPFWALRVRSWFGADGAEFHPYHLAAFAAVLAVLAVPVGLSGATLPLLFDRVGREVGELGRAAGRLYAWNTVGSLLGALFGGYLLLFWMDLHAVYRVALGAIALAAGLVTLRVYPIPRALVAGGVAVVMAGIVMLPTWSPDRLSSGLFRLHGRAPIPIEDPESFFSQWRRSALLVFHTDDPIASVAVHRFAEPGQVSDTAISTNGKPDGSIVADYPTMALAALIPALFVEEARRGFVIGYGTGVSVGELAALETMERVVVAEISPGVIEAGRFFERDNLGALASPKTDVVVADAYRALLRTEERFDVIVSEPSNPWVTGVEMLFSREFLTAARERLTPEGVYAQWFHLYENDAEVVELVLRTYASVFENVSVWYSRWPDVILLGFNGGSHALDLSRLERRASRPDIAAGIARAGIGSLAELLVHEVLPFGVVHAAGFEGDVHTLFHPVLSHRAARAFFSGTPARLPAALGEEASSVAAQSALLPRYERERGIPLRDEEYAEIARSVCSEHPDLCVTVMARWLREHPISAERERQITSLQRIPQYGRALGPEALGLVARLFRDGDSQASLPLPVAERATELFVRHHHYGLPFSREALDGIWSRCRETLPQNGTCREGRERAEALVGRLGRDSQAATGAAPPG